MKNRQIFIINFARIFINARIHEIYTDDSTSGWSSDMMVCGLVSGFHYIIALLISYSISYDTNEYMNARMHYMEPELPILYVQM